MKRALLLALLLVACGKSTQEELEDEIKKDIARTPKPDVKEPVKRELPASTKKVEEPDPEPTTPAEIDAARKKAMIAGKDKDVVRFCEMGKIDDKSDPQASLGCTLAACRSNDGEKATNWAKGLRNPKDKPLLEQAIKTCMALKVAL